MPNKSDAKKEQNSQSSKNIQIPPIPKQTAGAVAGAAAGSIAGPIGAVVGGVVGAVAGKAAEKRRPIAPAARRTVRSVMKSSKAISKAPRRRRPSKKSVAKPRKTRARYRGKAKKTVSRRSTTTKSRKGRELGDGRNRRGLLGNALSVAANGVSLSIRERLAVAHARKLIPHFSRPF
jgi:hypothetical protein